MTLDNKLGLMDSLELARWKKKSAKPERKSFLKSSFPRKY